jgi:alanine dehydrogenase
MPGAVPRTSTFALTNATLSYALKLARMGLREAIKSDRGLQDGINVFRGSVTCQGVADSLMLSYCSVRELVS